MEVIIWILASTFLISAISLVGAFVLSSKTEKLDKLLLPLVAISAGTLMAGAFLDLIPEAYEQAGPVIFSLTLIGFVGFFLMEKVLLWRHCHEGECDVHPFAYMNLVGDAVHNFIDGAVIAASFLTSIPLGISVSFAIAAHEIPQEICDFAVLLYGGMKRGNALFLNFATALTALLGALSTFFLFQQVTGFVPILLSIAAGGFLYISASDLIPELRKERGLAGSATTGVLFLAGIGLMIFLWSIVGVA